MKICRIFPRFCIRQDLILSLDRTVKSLHENAFNEVGSPFSPFRIVRRQAPSTRLKVRGGCFRRNAGKGAEYGKIAWIRGQEGLDSRLEVGGGKKRVEQPFSAQRELLQLSQELPSRGGGGKDENDVACSPPLFGDLARCNHVQRIGETPRIGDDVNELSENLRCNADLVGGGDQSG